MFFNHLICLNTNSKNKKAHYYLCAFYVLNYLFFVTFFVVGFVRAVVFDNGDVALFRIVF